MAVRAAADVAFEAPTASRLLALRRPLSRSWLVALGLVWLVPLWLLVITPMKSTPEYADHTQWTLPSHPLRLLDNLRTAWDSAGLGPGFVASLTYGLTGALLAILFGSLGAYAITRLGVKLGFFWFILVFSGTIFPFQMYLIPLFKLYTNTGLYDTWLGMALFYTAIAIPFCLFVMRGFFATIPVEIQDAARLDGASDFRIYWRMFMPLARGPIAVLLLFQFTWIWNDLLFGLVLSTSDGVRPITPSLLGLQGVYSNTGPPVVLAGALIGSLPTVLLFLFLGRYLLQGLVLSVGRE
jgi:multiple sugar transport system permease protein